MPRDPKPDPTLEGADLGDLATHSLAGISLDDVSLEETLALVTHSHEGSDPETATRLQTVDANRYEGAVEFARGGIGAIRSVIDRRLLRPVLIKELRSDQTPSPRALRRFEREIFISAALQHPGIVNILDAGRWGSGEPFFAMQRVRGEDFSEHIKTLSSLEQRLAKLSVVIDVANAMAYAHAQKIIHRDLKPANILVGHFGETVVIDWGLAKLIGEPEDSTPGVEQLESDAPLTLQGSVMGTPAFMAPEQAEGLPLDERADVYAIGAILYHLLSGHPPYTGTTKVVLMKLLQGDPCEPPLNALEEPPPDALISIVEKAMASDLEDRYRSARELAEDLQRFANGQLVGAHRYSIGGLIRRWISRNRPLVISISVALLVLSVVLVYSVETLREERDDNARQRDVNAKQRDQNAKQRDENAKQRDLIEESNAQLVKKGVEIEEKLTIIQAQKDQLAQRLEDIERLNRAIVTVHGEPAGAQLFVNGEPGLIFSGVGQMHVVELDAGAHRFEVRREGYHPQEATWTLTERQRFAPPAFSLLPADGSAPEGMVNVPAGSFIMGCDPQVQARCERDERPSRAVELGRFFINRTEVTVEAYRRCHEAGGCLPPRGLHSASLHFNWGADDRERHPINGLDWAQAHRFCEWAGKRLPSEAEWEKAARGTDGRTFPWGEFPPATPPDQLPVAGSDDDVDPCRFAVISDCSDMTLPVDERPDGASPYGAVDMAGNVWEWTQDWYDPRYYGRAPESDPPGPETGSARVPRGGGFRYDMHGVRPSNRVNGVPSGAHFNLGVRCARSPSP